MQFVNKKIFFLIIIVIILAGVLGYFLFSRKPNIVKQSTQNPQQQILDQRTTVVIKINSNQNTIDSLLKYLKEDQKISYNYISKTSPTYKAMYNNKSPEVAFELLIINTQTENQKNKISNYISKNFPEIIQTVK